jgi:ABC-2 type transport system ATP-binding protein
MTDGRHDRPDAMTDGPLESPAGATSRTQAGQSALGRPAVVVDGVWKRFGATDVVRDLSFEARGGELLGFLGPNGAGKTTTMRMILDIIRPDRGTISLFGARPSVAASPRVGYLPEERGLYRDVPVLDTLAYFGSLKGLPRREARERAARLLEEVGLGPVMQKKASELSRGMQQKAQVVATVLHEPDLLILDEPFQGLDPVNAELLRGIVLAQRDRGAAVVMSTHRMEEAEALCDRILLIDNGRRLLYGRLDEVRAAFSDGAVIAHGAGISVGLDGISSADSIQRSNGNVRFILRDGATARDLFRELAARDVDVDRFEVAAPSLDEIFIKVVEQAR